MEKKALGRGLSSLISPLSPEKETGVTKIRIEDLVTSRLQPREDFNQERLDELVISIKESGVIQPIVVRPLEKGYEVIAGERRLRAARALGLTELPAIVREADDKDALQISLIENVQRDNLNPIEEAQAYQRLMDEFGMTQEEIAQKVGKERTSVANTLRLLRLPQQVKEYIRTGKLTPGHGKALLSLPDGNAQARLAERFIEKALSVRQAEQSVITEFSPKGKKKSRHRDHHIASIEEELQRTLGTRVKILAGRRRGKIVIDYYSHDDLDRLISLLGRKAD